MVTAMEFGQGDVFLSMLWFFLFFIWIWLLITVFSDIFRSDDLSGWGKALWTIFVVVLPYLGVFVYLIARGKTMTQHHIGDAKAQEEAMATYVRSVAGTSSPAAEIERLAALQASGAITAEEFQQAKAKLLA